LGEARQALQPSLQMPDLVVMSLRNADGATLNLLNMISQAELETPVVLVAEAADGSTARHRNEDIVLSSELHSFSSSVRRLCRLKMRGWSDAEHGTSMPSS
jgi:DNA-binding NtrC family response regulator